MLNKNLSLAVLSGALFLSSVHAAEDDLNNRKRAADSQEIEGCPLPKIAKKKNFLETLEGMLTEEQESYRLKAMGGDLEALHSLGVFLRHSGEENNIAYAKACFRLGASRGHDDCRFQLANLIELDSFYSNSLDEEEHSEVIDIYRELAEKDHVDACSAYARCLESGIIIKKNYGEAAKYYQKAIDLGKASGLHENELFELMLERSSLDGLILMGADPSIDLVKRAEECKVRADAGSVQDQYSYSTYLNLGIGVEHNLALSLEYLERAARGGHSIALWNLGSEYRIGINVPYDFDRARSYLETAASLGCGFSKHDLGQLLLESQSPDDRLRGFAVLDELASAAPEVDQAIKSMAQNSFWRGVLDQNIDNVASISSYRQKALKYLDEQAETDPYAQLQKAKICMDSETNLEEAFELLKKAEESFCLEPTLNGEVYLQLGFCHHSGLGTEQNLEEAVKYFQLSYDLGEIRAASYLGQYLFYGHGGKEQDHDRALQLFQEAINSGDYKAYLPNARLCIIKNLPFPMGNIQELALNEQRPSYSAQYIYGYCLIKGLNCTQDLALGKELLRNAAIEGKIPEAGYLLGLLLTKDLTDLSEVRKDYKEGFNYFLKAGQDGHPDALIQAAKLATEHSFVQPSHRVEILTAFLKRAQKTGDLGYRVAYIKYLSRWSNGDYLPREVKLGVEDSVIKQCNICVKESAAQKKSHTFPESNEEHLKTVVAVLKHLAKKENLFAQFSLANAMKLLDFPLQTAKEGIVTKVFSWQDIMISVARKGFQPAQEFCTQHQLNFS